MSVQQQVRTLVEHHLGSLRDEVTTIDGKLRGLGTVDDDAERLDDLIASTHTLNGSCGSLGFREISAAAAVLEDHLRDMARSPHASVAPELVRARLLFGELKRLVARTTPADSRLYHAEFGPPDPASNS